MKKFLFLVVGLILALSFVGSISAQNSNAQIPEKNGDYPDPEHPGLRVHVFVYHPKPARPDTSQPVSITCPDNDPTSGPVVPPAGWHLPPTWTYTLNTNVPSTVGSTNLPIIAANAFSEWTGASGISILRTTPNTSVSRAKYDRQNIIAWGRTSGSALAVTYTWYYPGTGLAAETDTIFNSKFPWYWQSSKCTDANSYDAQDILTHELGHWMGLDDTYTDAYVDNTMYGYGSKGEVKKNTLTTGDTQGIQAIYP